jgi:hypothetical protein
VPGEYTATFDVPGQKLQARVRVEPDPRVNIPPEHYVAQRDAAIQVRDLLSRANRLVEALESVERQVRGLMPVASSSAAGNGSELEQACKAALQEIEELKDKATRPPPRMGYRQAPRLREELQSLFGTITAVASRPTEGEMTRLGELQAETTELETAWGRTLDGAIRRINQLAGGMPRIATRP